MEHLTLLHKTNIFIHVIAGSVALLTGIVILFAGKGTLFHKKAGKVFLILLAVVIFTGLVGVFIYGRNNFLLVITVLSGYLGYSGYRAVKMRHNQPRLADIGVALMSLLLVGYFIYYFHSIGMIWVPVIIYSTVGFLILVVMYDLLRYFIPKAAYANVWLSEHIWKMISAFTALLSAFCGTVFPQYQPYSQFMPSVFGSLLAIGFVIAAYRKKSAKRFQGSK
jgi:uncharacterized membrane protein